MFFNSKAKDDEREEKIDPEIPNDSPLRQYTLEERLRYALKRKTDEVRNLTNLIRSQEKIEKLIEAKVSAEVELKEYKRRMQAAFNSQQTQLEQQKKHMASLERKSRENSMMNEFYYRVINEAGIDVDHKGERERIHNEIYREMIMTSTAPKEEEDDR